MKLKTVFAITLALLGTHAAIAQSTGRPLIDTRRTWTTGGSEQSSKTVKDPVIPGGKAIEMTSTGMNSRYSANVSYRLTGAFQQGEKITMSGFIKAQKPTRIELYVELADAPYRRIGGGSIDVGTEWKPYSVAFVAPSDGAAGTTRAIVQLNGEARTVTFGPLSVVAEAGK